MSNAHTSLKRDVPLTGVVNPPSCPLAYITQLQQPSRGWCKSNPPGIAVNKNVLGELALLNITCWTMPCLVPVHWSTNLSLSRFDRSDAVNIWRSQLRRFGIPIVHHFPQVFTPTWTFLLEALFINNGASLTIKTTIPTVLHSVIRLQPFRVSVTKLQKLVDYFNQAS